MSPTASSSLMHDTDSFPSDRDILVSGSSSSRGLIEDDGVLSFSQIAGSLTSDGRLFMPDDFEISLERSFK
jgi:hypothetical protein